MEAAAAVPISEYLHTDYSPDVDYVDGVLEDRNVGENDHAWLQTALFLYLGQRRKELGIHVYVELRLKVSDTRYRVPDICVFTGERPTESVPSRPPFLAVEILSPEDRMTRMQTKVRDFLDMGVEFVWIIDPQTRTGWIHTRDRAVESRDGLFTAGPITLRLSELES